MAFETFSKRAAGVALVATTGMQVALHPDVTPPLQVAALIALAAGWLAADRLLGIWIAVAPLAPAAMLVIANRQGPVADLVWTAGLTGSLLRLLPWSRWQLPPLWGVLLGGWAVVLAFSWPVLVAREIAFDGDALRDAVTTTSWAGMTAPQVVAWTLYVVQIQLLGLLFFDSALGAFAAESRRVPRFTSGLWIGVSVASVVALIQGTVDIAFLNVDFWVERMRATGTMLDANAYGVAAALAAPVGFLLIGQSTRLRIVGSVLILAVNWTGVWMSSSKTGFLCAMLGGAGLLAGLAQAPERVMARGRRLLLAGAVATVALVVFFGDAIGPLQRVAASPPKIEELWTREGYGTIADRMVRDYPVTGVGVAAYRYLAPDYWRDIFDAQLQLDNAQNWWRQQAAEMGIAGGTLVVLWSIVVAWQLLAGRFEQPDSLRTFSARALLAGLAAISLASVPTQNPVVLLWFYFLVAWLAALTPVRVRAIPPAPVLTVCRRAALVLALIYVAGHVVTAYGSLSVEARARRFPREYVRGAYAPEPLPDGGEFRWTAERATFVLPVRGEALVFRLWAHHPDIAERPVTVTLAAPCGQVIQRELTSAAPFVLGVVVPPGTTAVDASIRVSRTWMPAEQGGSDTRLLGVAVSTDQVPREMALTRDYVAFWPVCNHDP